MIYASPAVLVAEYFPSPSIIKEKRKNRRKHLTNVNVSAMMRVGANLHYKTRKGGRPSFRWHGGNGGYFAFFSAPVAGGAFFVFNSAWPRFYINGSIVANIAPKI